MEWLRTDYSNAVFGGAVLAALAAFLIIALIVLLAFYIYHSLAWMRIAKRMNFKNAWLAWIPFAGSAMRLHLGRFHWAWIFLIFLPIVGWIALIILLTIAKWRIFEKRHYPGWLAISFPVMFIPGISWIGFIAYFIIIGVVAWGKK